MNKPGHVGDGVRAYLLERPGAAPELEGVRADLFMIATTSASDEARARANRMLEASGSPLPDEVHRFARAVGVLCAGAVYAGDKETRLRRAELLAEVLAEAQAASAERAA